MAVNKRKKWLSILRRKRSPSGKGIKMKKKQKRVKKPSVASLKRKAFKIWSEKARLAYGNKCAICGADGKIDAHHIISRRTCNLGLKFAIGNSVACCPSHHKFGFASFHNDPIWAYQWLLANRPKTIDYLNAHRLDKFGGTREDMMAIIAMLQKPVTDEELAILNLPRLPPAEQTPEKP